MQEKFYKLMGVEHGEESMISLLLTQSVFLGVFFGAFDISAHSFFLSVFDEKMMARGYVLSGMAGIILTSLYTWLQTKIRFRNFSTANLLFVTALTFILWILLTVNPDRWVIWLVFIMLGPLNILGMLGFWGTVSRLFTLRQGKRLFGLVDAGLVIGVIISCYAIPILLSLNFRPHNILLISTGAVLTGSILQIIIGSRFDFTHGKSEKETTVDSGKPKGSFLTVFRSDSYIRTMALFIALSVMTAFFVQYSFMAVTREQYPAEDDMARFLGLFTGSMMIFTLLVKLLVFSYLIKNYGLKTCLALSPVLIVAFSAIAVLIGLVKGYTLAAGLGFLLFFMLLALSRLFSKSLKDAIESPSFKVIYQTIDEKIRYEVQSGMDGTINEIAALTSGLLLAGMGILSFVKLIHFSFVLIFIAAFWILIALKLYAGYRNSIRKALDAEGKTEIQDADKKKEIPDHDNRFSSALNLKTDYFNLISGNHELLKNKSSGYLNLVIDEAEEEHDINLLPALKVIASNQSASKEIRQRSEKAIESLRHLTSGYPEKDIKLFEARKILSDSRMPQTTQVLRLLRDSSLSSKRIAIYMIGKFRMTDMLSEVTECLNIPELESQAAAVLKSFGREADEELRRYYLMSSGNLNISKRILRLLGENSGRENQSFLFGRLWSNSRQLRETTVRELKACGFIPTEEEKDRLHQAISDIIGIMVWNLSAKITLSKENNPRLLDALVRETARWNSFLFDILSITYDAGSIGRIKENLEGGTVESVNFALEMIDMVIDDSVKPKIIPLLDVISDEEKVRHLYQFYPGNIPDYKTLVEDIINRDYNLLGIWVRACALRSLKKVDSESLKESVIALLFSPEIILQEESARVLAASGNDILKEIGSRIPHEKLEHLKKITASGEPDKEYIYEKVIFLSSCIGGMDEEDLLFPGGSLITFRKSGKEKLPAVGSFICWNENNNNARIIYNYAGFTEKDLPDSDQENLNYILPLSVVEEYHNQFPEKAFRILNYIENIEK